MVRSWGSRERFFTPIRVLDVFEDFMMSGGSWMPSLILRLACHAVALMTWEFQTIAVADVRR